MRSMNWLWQVPFVTVPLAAGIKVENVASFGHDIVHVPLDVLRGAEAA
jgi:hypothetical protein